jgi:hypothetical protein
MTGRWVCDYCGATGKIPDGDTADQVQCDQCGEPVMELP